MTILPAPPPIEDIIEIDPIRFHEQIRPAGKPVVLRGLVSHWPSVAAARRGSETMRAYLDECFSARPVRAIVAPPEAGGRFFYNDRMTGLNFEQHHVPLSAFLSELIAQAASPSPPAMAVQSEIIPEISPRFAVENPLDLVPSVAPRIWVGNRIRVAPHYDLMENVACNVSGRRRFTLFPPDQLANLYPGPFELTPAGTPVSMVDVAAPDLKRFPRFEEAWSHASQTILEPGDALYIPYAWWHAVDSLETLSILVNYWWADVPEGIGGPYDALLHAMLSFRHLPPAEKAVWKRMIDHYVFEATGDPAEHLPMHARGILAPQSAQLFARMKTLLRQALQR